MGNGPPQSIANPSRLEAFDIWLPRDPDQKTLWSTKIHLDQKFYSSLKEHALPVDIRAIRSFANSAKQIDIILWLGYRLRTVKRSYEIKWSLLHDRFGSSVGRIRRFKEDFREDLKAIYGSIPQASRQADGNRPPADAMRCREPVCHPEKSSLQKMR
jgi:hypothetical protein